MTAVSPKEVTRTACDEARPRQHLEMRLLKVSPAKIVACSDKLFAHSISHSLLQALEARLCPMVMLVGEAVRRLRDNDGGLVELEGAQRGKWDLHERCGC